MRTSQVIDLGLLGVREHLTAPAEFLAAVALDGKSGRAAMLTYRELEIAIGVSEGLELKQVAARLGTTEGTVRSQVSRLYRMGWTRISLALYGVALKISRGEKIDR